MDIFSITSKLAFRLKLAAVVTGGVLFTALLLAAVPKPTFTQEGDLVKPHGYRQWVFVGAPVTPNELNPPRAAFPEFHNVYIHPDYYEHYKKTGKFRDGTILIKELVSIGSKQASSGKGYFQGDYIGLEAAVKDSKRFPNEPGHWGYFTFSHSAPPYPETAKLNPTGACNACHQANAAEDWVFTQFYPVLRAVNPN